MIENILIQVEQIFYYCLEMVRISKWKSGEGYPDSYLMYKYAQMSNCKRFGCSMWRNNNVIQLRLNWYIFS